MHQEEEKQRPLSRTRKNNPMVNFLANDACRYQVVRATAMKMGWRLCNDRRNCNVLWLDTSNNVNDYFHRMQPWQNINHFPGISNIARKSRLAQNIEMMRKMFPKDYRFAPQTYVLPGDIIEFKKNFGPKGRSKKIFIIKPDAGAQGRGIFLTRTLSDINLTSTFVAQHYIKNPLLIDKKKFDLRIYALITSCDPLRIYLFRDGLVRLCTEEFEAPNSQNMKDRCMHLTNYSINKFSEKFDAGDDHFENDDTSEYQNGSEGSKRSLEWFLSSMRKERGDAKVDRLWRRISHICSATILSILPTMVREYNNTFGIKSCIDLRGRDNLNSEKRNTDFRKSRLENEKEFHKVKVKEDEVNESNQDESVFLNESRCFQILGFDVLIDENLRPYLVEVNQMPSYGTDTNIDKRVKSKLIQETLSIVKARPGDKQIYQNQMKVKSKDRLMTKQDKSKCDEKNGTEISKQSKTVGTYTSDSDRNEVESDLYEEIKREITLIYEHHVPDKVSKIPLLLKKYKGSEEWLLAEVKKKYGNLTSDEAEYNVSDEEKMNQSSIIVNDNAPRVTVIPCDTNNEEGEESHDTESETSDSEISCCDDESDHSENYYSSKAQTTPVHEVYDPILEQERQLLSGFDLIYPITGDGSNNIPDYKAMEDYIFDIDAKKQMRLTCPLGLSRQYVSSTYRKVEDVSYEQIQEKLTHEYKVWSAEAWAKETQSLQHSLRSKTNETVPSKDLPQPTPKQMKAADRLSKGMSSDGTLKKLAYPNCYLDPSWQLSSRILPSIQENSFQNNTTKKKSQKKEGVPMKLNNVTFNGFPPLFNHSSVRFSIVEQQQQVKAKGRRRRRKH